MGIFMIKSVKEFTLSNIWLFWVAFFGGTQNQKNLDHPPLKKQPALVSMSVAAPATFVPAPAAVAAQPLLL